MPEDTRRGEITKLLVEKGSKELFSSFGETRKKLERKGVFLKDVKQEDIEKILPIFEKFQVEIDQKNHDSSPAHKSSFPWKPIIAYVVLSASATGGYFYYKRNKFSNNPSPITSLIATNNPQDQTSETPAQPRDPLLDARRKEEHANIEALLISTATVVAGNLSGSAFFVSNDGHLISNAHVTTTLKEVGILTFDGKRYVGKVLKTDSYYDLSLIKIDSKEYPPLKIGDATKLHPGDTVWTVGAPHGLSFSVTRGVASYIGRNVGGKAFLQADVAINPGNSGGPMIDDDGEVIGINNFIIQQTQGLNFAIPVNYLYMGANPILANVISTQADSPIMATWRSWEGSSSPINAINVESPGSEGGSATTTNNDEITKLAGDLKALDASFKNVQTQNQDRVNSIQKEIDATTIAYGNTVGISEQEKIGRKLKKLRIDLVDVEISNFDEYLRYNKNVMEIILRVRQLSTSDASVVQQYDAQIVTLNKAKKDNEAQRSAKLEEKKALQAQNY